MSQRIKKILLILGQTALFCLFLFVTFKIAHAQGYLGDDSLQFLEGELKSFGVGAGEDVAVNVVERGIGIVKYIVGAAAILFGIIYATQLVFARGKEEAITKAKTNFLWIFVGFLVLMISGEVAKIFNPEKATSEALIDFDAGRDKLREIANWLKWLFGSIIVFLMVISGIRMITSADNEEAITKEKQHLLWSGIGMLVILLASNIVNAIYVVNEAGTDVQVPTEGAAPAIIEIGGIIRLILVFLGPLAVLFTIYAGFIYMTAFEQEERAQKARRMIVAGVSAIVIIYAAFALVNTLIGTRPEGIDPETGEPIKRETLEEIISE